MAPSITGHCFLVALFLLSVTASGQLSENFYNATCPGLENIIKTEVISALATEKRMGASLLRLFFHDCFVQGCDASVLLDNTTVSNSERDASPNANSLRGFNVIDTIKTKVEASCSGVVSCADILALATREAVFQLSNGTTSWTLKLGRRDSTTANKNQAESDLPGPGFSISQLKAAFQKKGFNPNELAALSGAHTIGLARCGFAANTLLVATRPECMPLGSGLTALDVQTPVDFDNKYYGNLINNTGLLKSDQELMKDATLKKLVKDYSSKPALFAADFASAMIKLSELAVLTGTNGQIRANCNKVNSN